jgi:hypothetical protein
VIDDLVSEHYSIQQLSIPHDCGDPEHAVTGQDRRGAILANPTVEVLGPMNE